MSGFSFGSSTSASIEAYDQLVQTADRILESSRWNRLNEREHELTFEKS